MQKNIFRTAILISLLMAWCAFSADSQIFFPPTPLQESLLEGFMTRNNQVEVMIATVKEGLPFVLDLDRGEAVWNFPYDQVQIDEFKTVPLGFDESNLASGGTVKYYHIHMVGTGYPDKDRNYDCFVQRGASGKVTKSVWIKTPNTHKHPDFMWRPHPMTNIHDIYMQSIQ